jgi:plasmid stabilization system protein ParE
MAYHVDLSVRAMNDLRCIYEWIEVEQSIKAPRWYWGLVDAINSLENFPHRCPATKENSRLKHLLHDHRKHVYRIIFRISEAHKKVEVIHIRHGAQSDFDVKSLK